MNNEKNKLILLTQKEINELTICYKKISDSLKEMNEIKERIEAILNHEKIEHKQDRNYKIPGGGKIVLMNGEFRKVFGSLLKAIQNKYNNNIYFFSQNEYEILSAKNKNELLNDQRNITWEHKNYHVKKRNENKSNKFNNIIKMSKTIFIRTNKRLNTDKIKIKTVSNYIQEYSPINSRIKSLLLILNSEKKHPYCLKKNQYIPKPENIQKFIFNEKEKKKFFFKNATVNWTNLELYFMKLSKYFRNNIPNQKEIPGIPYITDELAIQILKSNINLKSNLFKEFEEFLAYKAKHKKPDLLDFIYNFSNFLNTNYLTRDDYFALAKILKIPIFDFNSQVISVIDDLKIKNNINQRKSFPSLIK